MRISARLEFEAESTALVVGIQPGLAAAQLYHMLTGRRCHVDAQSLQISPTVSLPSRQSQRLVSGDDQRLRWRLGQTVVAQERLSSLDDRLQQFATRLGARQHVVPGIDVTKELGVDELVALRWNVGNFEVERLPWTTG